MIESEQIMVWNKWVQWKLAVIIFKQLGSEIIKSGQDTVCVFNADSDTGGYTWEMENIMNMLPSSRKQNRCYYLTDTILTWSSMTSFYIASTIICPCWSLTPNNVAHILIYADVNLCLRDYLIWHRNMTFTYKDKLLIESSILHNDQDLIKETESIQIYLISKSYLFKILISQTKQNQRTKGFMLPIRKINMI